MLRIRKDANLKELEKFDFKYFDNVGQWQFTERNIVGATYIYVNAWNRRIVYRQDKDKDTMCLIKLYDLIQARISRERGGRICIKKI